MIIDDLSNYCRLCLMPLNEMYIDCAHADNKEFKETIKLVYNVDINAEDEYSTKVCLLCCDVLTYNTIHVLRTVEAQKSWTRVQRIKNKLRNFGKKKKEIKEKKKPLLEPINDVEMTDAEQNCSQLYPIVEYEMDVTNESGAIIPSAIQQTQQPTNFFGNLTSFHTNQYQSIAQQSQPVNFIDWNDQNHLPAKRKTDTNNGTKPSTSLFQIAKNFCGNMMKKQKSTGNVELGLDEITNRMASLQFTSQMDISVGF